MTFHHPDSDHDHAIPHLNLPAGFVVDHTDKGVLWDPKLSAYSYSYDAATQTFTPYDPTTPVNWLYFNGQWGDPQLPGGPGIFGQYKYTDGPNGPKIQGSGPDHSVSIGSLRGTSLLYLETRLGQLPSFWSVSERSV
jgi:hypothetical protein